MERCPDSVYFIRCVHIYDGYLYWMGDGWTADITVANGYVDKPTKLPKERSPCTNIEVIDLDAWQRSRQ